MCIRDRKKKEGGRIRDNRYPQAVGDTGRGQAALLCYALSRSDDPNAPSKTSVKEGEVEGESVFSSERGHAYGNREG